ncbi:MAG: hypothetical protein HY344_04670 [Candidatus Levybacteria bacterium]|nr:hypothetical protein [Candidatus Levybacteria bacterium]
MTEQKPSVEINVVSPGLLVILTGPTAAGKTEIRERMVGKHRKLKSLVTTTSRPKRPSETDGIDYHFIDPEHFLQRVELGHFLEYAEYGGNLYGTTKDELERVLRGEVLMSTMEISGAARFEEHVREAYDAQTAEQILSRSITVYIDPGSEETQRYRFIHREAGLGNFETRLLQDRSMLKDFGDKFKHKVLNPDQEHIDKAIEGVEKLLEGVLQVQIGNLFS